MGSVYLADSPEGRTVALKVIRADLAVEPEFRRRFRSEVTRAQEVPPFCTAEVLDSDPDHETPYLVVEYVDGPSLAEVVLDRGPLTPANLYGLAIGVATALYAIHSAGVIHRDLKPSNVLLAPGSPKVIDFGIAQAASGTDGDTRTDQLIGTVSYMAPERLDPGVHAALTPAADIFAWGAVLAFAATGRVPFMADSSPATAVAILTRPPDLDGITEPLKSLVAQALAKNPLDRPSARELLDELLSRTPKGVLAAVAEKSSENPIVNAVVQNLSTDVVAAAHEVPAEFTSALQYSYVDVTGEFATVPAGRGPDPSALTEIVRPPRRRAGRALRGLGITLLVLIVLTTAGAVAGFATGYLHVPGSAGAGSPPAPSVTPSSAPSPSALPSPPPSPSLSPSPSVPPSSSAETFPKKIVVDSLAAPGNWKLSDPTATNGSCAFNDAHYVISLLQIPDVGVPTYRCQGISNKFTDVLVSVNIRLLTPGSCAGIWFHLTSVSTRLHGYGVQVCTDGITVGDNGVADFAQLGLPIPFATPIPLNTAVRITVEVSGDRVLLFRNGVELGRPLEGLTGTYASGYVGLGVIQHYGDTATPYEVAFDHIEVDAPQHSSP